MAVFYNFKVANLSSGNERCICHYKWFSRFLDPLTMTEQNIDPTDPKGHVCTTNLEMIHDKSFCKALVCGFNHILEQPTIFTKVIREILLACT